MPNQFLSAKLKQTQNTLVCVNVSPIAKTSNDLWNRTVMERFRETLFTFLQRSLIFLTLRNIGCQGSNSIYRGKNSNHKPSIGIISSSFKTPILPFLHCCAIILLKN